MMHLNPQEYVDSFVIKYGFYEREVFEAISSSIKNGDVFWDIGANIGLHALSLKAVNPTVDVFAFEPNPSMVDRLFFDSHYNFLDINIEALAVNCTSGITDFYVFEGNSGRSSLARWNPDEKAAKIAVKAVSGDAFSALHGVPNVIKIDVEGLEFSVLEGMADALSSRQLRAIIFEDSPDSDTKVKKLIERFGFNISRLIREEASAHKLENFLARRN